MLQNNSEILEVLDSLKLISVIKGLVKVIDAKTGKKDLLFLGSASTIKYRKSGIVEA